MGLRSDLVQTQGIWLALLDGVCLCLSIVSGVLLRSMIGPLDVGLSGYVVGHLDGWIFFCAALLSVTALGVTVLLKRRAY